jgi:hypothetical protein
MVENLLPSPATLRFIAGRVCLLSGSPLFFQSAAYAVLGGFFLRRGKRDTLNV